MPNVVLEGNMVLETHLATGTHGAAARAMLHHLATCGTVLQRLVSLVLESHLLCDASGQRTAYGTARVVKNTPSHEYDATMARNDAMQRPSAVIQRTILHAPPTMVRRRCGAASGK